MKKLSFIFALFLLALPPSPCRADLIKQSSAYSRTILMTDSADHITGKTGLTLSVSLSKAGAAFASISPTVTEIGAGRYKIALLSSNTDTLGALDLAITASGADPTDSHDQVVAFDPNDASLLGLSGVATSATQANNTSSVAAIKAKTDLIATNAADSPNAQTAQVSVAALPSASANASAVWSAGTRTLTDKSGFSLSQAFPTNFSLLSITGGGAITTSNPAMGGSSLTAADVWGYGTRTLSAQSDTPGTATLLSRIPGVVQPQTGDAFARLGTPVGSSISADIAALPTLSQIEARFRNTVVDNSGSTPLTFIQSQAILQSVLANRYVPGTLNPTTHTDTTTYYKMDGVTPICVSTRQFNTSNTVVIGRTTIFTNLP